MERPACYRAYLLNRHASKRAETRPGSFWLWGYGKMKWLSTEDAILKQYASHKTASEIGIIIGRSEIAVYRRASRLNVSMLKRGDSHWNAVLSDVQRLAVSIMHDGGMTPEECFQVITGQPEIKKAAILKICKG